MPATDLYHAYGWKARIGLIVPSTNTVNEPEFWRLAPPGVTIHTSRVLLLGQTTAESYIKMGQALDRAAEELATAEVDIIAYGCTSGSIICPLPQVLKQMSDKTGTPAIAAAGSVVAALRAFGIKRLALGTPYVDFVNQAEKKFLEDYGFEVTSMYGMELGKDQPERRSINRVPPEALFQLARRIDRPEAQAIFISCTALSSLDVVAEIEREFNKPVIVSNLACFWSCLRMLGLRTPIHGYGRLLEEKLEPITARSFDMIAPAGMSA